MIVLLSLMPESKRGDCNGVVYLEERHIAFPTKRNQTRGVPGRPKGARVEWKAWFVPGFPVSQWLRLWMARGTI